MDREQSSAQAKSFNVEADRIAFMRNPHVQAMGAQKAAELYDNLMVANLAVHGGARDALDRFKELNEDGKSPFVSADGKPQPQVIEGHRQMLDSAIKEAQIHGGEPIDISKKAIVQTVSSPAYQRLAKESGTDIQEEWGNKENPGPLRDDISIAMRELNSDRVKEQAQERAHEREREEAVQEINR